MQRDEIECPLHTILDLLIALSKMIGCTPEPLIASKSRSERADAPAGVHGYVEFYFVCYSIAAKICGISVSLGRIQADNLCRSGVFQFLNSL